MELQKYSAIIQFFYDLPNYFLLVKIVELLRGKPPKGVRRISYKPLVNL